MDQRKPGRPPGAKNKAPAKSSATLSTRVSTETKAEFVSRCKADSFAPSEMLARLVGEFLKGSR